MPAVIIPIIEGIIIGGSIVEGVVIAAALFLINKVLEPSAPKTPNKGASQLINYFSTEAPLALIVGTTRIGGMDTIPPMLSGENGQYLHKVLSLTGHEIDSFESVYFNNDLIPGSLITPPAGNTNDGGIASGTGYAGYAAIRCYTGTTTQTADYKLVNEVTPLAGSPAMFTSNFRGRGIAYAAIQFVYNQDIFRGVPSTTFDINGAKMYDPRLDSTVAGGSGSHRADTPSTWEYPVNPNGALGLAWYLLTATGGGYDKSEFNWTSFITAANVCDPLVATPIPFTTFVNIGTGTNDGRNFYKASGASAWDSGSYSTDGISSGVISASIYATGKESSFGLHTVAGLPATAYFGAYVIDFAPAVINIYESGVKKFTVTRNTAAGIDWARIGYDGQVVRYYINGKHVRSTAVAQRGMPLYLNVGEYESGAGVILGNEPRYSCNGELFAALSPDDFIANCKQLADSMLGRLIYANGVWSCLAGSWQAPTFTIPRSAWIGPLSLKLDGGIAGRFNRMHTWYIDPLRNYQKVESMPRSSDTYLAADGNKRIDRETDQLLCDKEYEAQRKGEFIMRASRNQIVVTGRLPPAYQDLSTLDTGTIVFEELGWASKTFRCIANELNPDGTYLSTFQEEQSSDWTDLAIGEYNKPSTIPISATNYPIPSAPAGLSMVETIAGTINFAITPGVVKPLNTRFQILAAPTSTSFASSGNVLYDGSAVNVFLPATPGINYYAVRAYATSYYSGSYPDSYGLAFAPTYRADNTTLTGNIVPDQDFSVGTPAFWMWTANSTGYLPPGVDEAFTLAGSAAYVSSLTGGSAGGLLVSAVSSLPAPGGGLTILALPHPNAVSSYGIPTDNTYHLYRYAMRFRINSLSATGTSPTFRLGVVRRLMVPNSLQAVLYGEKSISVTFLTGVSVGSMTTISGYFSSRSSSGGEQYKAAAFGYLKVVCNNGAKIGFALDYLNLERIVPHNQALIPTTLVSSFMEEHLSSLIAYPSQTSSVEYHLNALDVARWPINERIFMTRVASSAPGRLRTDGSYFLTIEGGSAVTSVANVAPNVSGMIYATRTGSYNFFIEGSGVT